MSHQTEVFQLGQNQVTVALDAGPRILGFSREDGPDLFASLPGEYLESKAGRLALLGGHRLWRAPEIPEVTYQPDDEAIAVDGLDDGVRLTGSADRDGVVKSMEVRERGELTVVDHVLHNDGAGMVRCAAWSITQLKPGGTAIVPFSAKPADPAGVLPNRFIVLWPYTDLGAPEIEFRTDEIRIQASRSHGPAKLGTANRRGWLGYTLGDELFVKWSGLHDDGADYADLGASVECYRDHRFLELETLSPLVTLEPGRSVHHREVWQLTDLGGRRLDEVLASLPDQAEVAD